MSSIGSPSPSPSSPEVIIGHALANYAKRTDIDLVKDPFTIRVGNCDSPHTIFYVLMEQTLTFDEAKNDDTKLTKCLRLITDGLQVISLHHSFSDSAGLVSLKIAYPQQPYINARTRRSHLHNLSLPELASFLQYESPSPPLSVSEL